MNLYFSAISFHSNDCVPLFVDEIERGEGSKRKLFFFSSARLFWFVCFAFCSISHVFMRKFSTVCDVSPSTVID